MSTEEFKEAVRAGVREAMSEHCASMLPCGITKAEHDEHHRLMKGASKARSIIFTVAVQTIAGGGLVWIGFAIWEHFRKAVNQ